MMYFLKTEYVCVCIFLIQMLRSRERSDMASTMLCSVRIKNFLASFAAWQNHSRIYDLWAMAKPTGRGKQAPLENKFKRYTIVSRDLEMRTFHRRTRRIIRNLLHQIRHATEDAVAKHGTVYVHVSHD